MSVKGLYSLSFNSHYHVLNPLNSSSILHKIVLKFFAGNLNSRSVFLNTEFKTLLQSHFTSLDLTVYRYYFILNYPENERSPSALYQVLFEEHAFEIFINVVYKT